MWICAIRIKVWSVVHVFNCESISPKHKCTLTTSAKTFKARVKYIPTAVNPVSPKNYRPLLTSTPLFRRSERPVPTGPLPLPSEPHDNRTSPRQPLLCSSPTRRTDGGTVLSRGGSSDEVRREFSNSKFHH